MSTKHGREIMRPSQVALYSIDSRFVLGFNYRERELAYPTVSTLRYW